MYCAMLFYVLLILWQIILLQSIKTWKCLQQLELLWFKNNSSDPGPGGVERWCQLNRIEKLLATNSSNFCVNAKVGSIMIYLISDIVDSVITTMLVNCPTSCHRIPQKVWSLTVLFLGPPVECLYEAPNSCTTAQPLLCCEKLQMLSGAATQVGLHQLVHIVMASCIFVLSVLSD